VAEYRLFPENTVPEFTTLEFFERHPRIAHEHQAGFEERTELATREVIDLVQSRRLASVVDLGCDDGELLSRVRDELPHLELRGYTAGAQSAEFARERGLDVRRTDFLTADIEWGDVTVMTEVLEHLLDPHSFLKRVESPYLVASSPSAETDEWHYEHHAWAWDVAGYRVLLEDAGWHVLELLERDATPAVHCGQLRPQRFQVIAARR
jgi:hypothetical protein